MSDQDKIAAELDAIRQEGRFRFLRALPAVGGRFEWENQTVLNFASNDYLDLASNANVIEAAQRALAEYGCGATASRLLVGHLTLHADLEERLAALVEKETALAFPSGYQTNVGVISTLAGPDDLLLSDELNHASIVDGCRLSRARTLIYRHCDVAHLEELLRSTACSGRRIIVSDSVFSMDGDLAPVEALAALAERFEAFLMIDEAHAIGVFGSGGGLCREQGVRADVIVGTLSKSLGAGGGFAAGSREFQSLLINKARSFIFSTGLSPACVGGAMAAIDLLNAEPGLGERLRANASRFQQLLADRGFDVAEPASQVIPIHIGDNELTMQLSQALFEQGLLVAAVRPPTVPKGTARLRLSLTLAHSDEDLTRAADLLAQTARKTGILS